MYYNINKVKHVHELSKQMIELKFNINYNSKICKWCEIVFMYDSKIRSGKKLMDALTIVSDYYGYSETMVYKIFKFFE